MREIAIIRGIGDCENVFSIVKDIVSSEINVLELLKEYLQEYKEYAFDIRTGDILYMILKNGNLSITVKVQKDVSLLSNDNFESAIYDIKTGEILCAKKDGHLLVSGDIIYDSLNNG